jgi:hypothetical protein
VWKHNLANSVVAVYQKLSTYYSKTFEKGREVYSWATVLNRSKKLELYKISSFSSDDYDGYEKSYCEEVAKNYTTLQPPAKTLTLNLVSLHNMHLADIARTQQHISARRMRKHALVKSYLRTKQNDDKDLLAFRASHEGKNPVISQMVKDILTMRMSSVGF